MVDVLIAHWKELYEHSAAASATVAFAHLSGLVLGGGSAVAADLGTLRAVRFSPGDRPEHLAGLGRIHRVVVVGLGLVFVSGLLMVAADLDQFLGSRLFWIKMTLVVALLTNGALLLATERRLAGPLPAPRGFEPTGWRRLEQGAVASLVLWFGLLFLGTLLRTA